MSEQTNEEKPVEKWTVGEVKEWIGKKDIFNAYLESFNFTNGEALLALTTENLILMGLPQPAAQPLLALIQNLKEKTDLETIISSINMPKFTQPLPLPSIPSFISRGQKVENTISKFLRNNMLNRNNKDKHFHSFLYCVNGSGYGKTWIGFSVPHRLAVVAASTKHVILPLFIDFSSGSSWSEKIDFDPSVGLGFRVAANFIFHCDYNELLNSVDKENISAFQFPFVMKWISSRIVRGPHEYLLVVLHLDELQTDPNRAQNLLHEIGNYMCRTNPNIDSYTLQHKVILYPVITATSSKGFKQRITDYDTQTIQLTPFSYRESCDFLSSRGINLATWSSQTSFKRLVKSSGGLPRCLQILYEEIVKMDERRSICDRLLMPGEIQILFDNLRSVIDSMYKINNWEPKFGGIDNLKLVVAMCLCAAHVTPDTQVNNSTIEDIQMEGVIFLSPTDGKFNIVLPLVILHSLNHYFSLFPFDICAAFAREWDWSSFEKWESEYEVIKNNTLFWLKLHPSYNVPVNLSTYYNCKSEFANSFFSVSYLCGVTEESHQFLKKDVNKPASPSDSILTNIGTFSSQTFKDYSFRCAAGNPSVDSRIYRLADPNDSNQIPWMICKQLKHTKNNNTAISYQKVVNAYRKWELRMKNFYTFYRCFFVLITNQSMNQEDLKTFQKEFRCAAVVCKENFGEYCRSSFSLYSIFDDDRDQKDEEMHFGEIEPYIPSMDFPIGMDE